MFDYDIIKKWIEYCQCFHFKDCRVDSGSHMEGLRFTDCKTKSIIWAPANCQHLMLSYVWGSVERNMTKKKDIIGPLPSHVPPIIQDAIKVVLALNHRYLRVDRYCIQKSNEDGVHNQMNNMNMIYSNAVDRGGNDVTVIIVDVSLRHLFHVYHALVEHVQW